ncbi:uncharacterized protein N7515_003583 [Penicillium bovifimosum]|uniref:Uncharacterized protein n=1 Tax=Penicillium bovifimosum TaxID=126998 RepID=A0A9W9L6C3_9EURO|nr:uncharacterized protein N7515_003583 [Penicillium bovifimosum]KAJ5138735.1 hypothetical protein N7515_003583 [Penicillium bovifimosum]
MPYNDIPASLHARVILKDSSSWELWLFAMKAIATSHGVWDLCNPEKETQPDLPEPPIEPTTEWLMKTYPETWEKMVTTKNADYDRQKATYDKKIAGVHQMEWEIRNSLHSKYQVFIDQDTAWGLMRNLRQRLAPECDPTYKASLRSQWRNLDRGLDKGTDIEEWLNNWQSLQRRCAKAGITEAKEAQIQFLEAVSVMSPDFHAVWIDSVEKNSADATKSSAQRDADFNNLIRRYKAHWDITHGKSNLQKGVSKAVFSTWQGHQEANHGTATPNKSASKAPTKKPSFCVRGWDAVWFVLWVWNPAFPWKMFPLGAAGTMSSFDRFLCGRFAS